MSGKKNMRNHPKTPVVGKKGNKVPQESEKIFMCHPWKIRVGKAFPTSGQRGTMLVQISTLEPMSNPYQNMDIPSRNWDLEHTLEQGHPKNSSFCEVSKHFRFIFRNCGA